MYQGIQSTFVPRLMSGRPDRKTTVCLFLFGWVAFILPGAQAGDVLLNNLTATEDITGFGGLTIMEGELPTNRPVLYYSFSQVEQSGSVRDDSFHGHDGTHLGPVWTTPGKVGDGAYHFSATNDFIDVTLSSALDLTGPFTLAAWINPSVPADPWGPGILAKGANMTSVTYGLMWFSPGKIGFYSTGGNSSLWTADGTAPTGAWTHVVGVLEGSGTGEAKIYINGSLSATGTMNLPHAHAGPLPLYIGRWRNQYYYKGLIDEVAVYDRALSSTEVGDLYASTAESLPGVSPLFHVASHDVSVSGPLTVGVAPTLTNLTVTGWTKIPYLVPQGDISMGDFTEGAPE